MWSRGNLLNPNSHLEIPDLDDLPALEAPVMISSATMKLVQVVMSYLLGGGPHISLPGRFLVMGSDTGLSPYQRMTQHLTHHRCFLKPISTFVTTKFLPNRTHPY